MMIQKRFFSIQIIIWCIGYCFPIFVIAQPKPPLRNIPNEAFGLGEELYYKVSYKFITAGTGSFKIGQQALEYNGMPCYDIRFEVQSLKSLDWLYRVRDTYRTVVDIGGIFPWFFEQHNREGGYSKDFWAELRHDTGLAKTNEGDFAIEPFTHDVLSAFFYVRTLDLRSVRVGASLTLKNFAGKETFDLKVRVLGRETISVEAGTFRCIILEPLVMEGGLFKNEGKILLWLSDDGRKIPVRVRTKVLIGNVDAELTSYKGLRGPLFSRVE